MMKKYFNWLGVNNEGVRRIIKLIYFIISLSLPILFLIASRSAMREYKGKYYASYYDEDRGIEIGNMNLHFLNVFISSILVSLIVILIITIIIKTFNWIREGFKKESGE